MHEEEWGHFIDLEIGKETTIQNKSQVNPENRNLTNTDSTNSEPPPPPPNTKPQKQKKEIQHVVTKKLNSLSVIYEEEIWYKRDEEDDSDYGNTWNYIYGTNKETIIKRKEYINKASFVMYCFICMSFISWSSICSL